MFVAYRVWYKVLNESPSHDSTRLTNGGAFESAREKRLPSGKSNKKAAYRYERYNNRNKVNIDSPGENGGPVVLTGKDKSLADSLFKKEAFNIIASNRIALNRTVKDIRDPA